MPVPPPAAPTKPGGQSGNATSRTKGKGGIPEPTPEEIELDKQRNRIKQSQNQMQKIQTKKKARSDSDTVHATKLRMLSQLAPWPNWKGTGLRSRRLQVRVLPGSFHLCDLCISDGCLRDALHCAILKIS